MRESGATCFFCSIQREVDVRGDTVLVSRAGEIDEGMSAFRAHADLPRSGSGAGPLVENLFTAVASEPAFVAAGAVDEFVY